MEAATRHLNVAVDINDAELPRVELDPDIQKVLAGEPRIYHKIIDKSPDGTVERGLWELTEGTITDEEYDELFVVIRGRATVDFDDGSRMELGPGSVGLLADGARTVWHVHEDLRKAYQITYTRPPRW